MNPKFSSWTSLPDDATRGHVNSMYTTGSPPKGDTIIYRFPNKDTVLEWQRMVNGIKDRAAYNNARKCNNNQHVANMYDWFALVADLETRFGAELVPPDVVRVARNVNTELAEWHNKTIKFGDAKARPAADGCKRVKVMHQADPKVIDEAE